MDKKQKIYSLTDEASILIQTEVLANSEEFQSWYKKCKYTLRSMFGDDSCEYKEFVSIQFQRGIYDARSYNRKMLEDTQKGLKIAITLLFSVCDNLNDTTIDKTKTNCIGNLNRVLIIYGHNDALKQIIARTLEKQNIEPIILNEKTDIGLTIIEKFEKHANCGAAICLFSADDFGNSLEEKNCNKRARQNVVFETGFYIGKFGRDKTIILADEDIEMPSDLDGVIYISTNGNYEIEVLKSLRSIGYNVDFNKVI